MVEERGLGGIWSLLVDRSVWRCGSGPGRHDQNGVCVSYLEVS